MAVGVNVDLCVGACTCVEEHMCDRDNRERNKTVCSCAGLMMLVCLQKSGAPIKEGCRTCVRGTGTGELGKAVERRN